MAKQKYSLDFFLVHIQFIEKQRSQNVTQRLGYRVKLIIMYVAQFDFLFLGQIFGNKLQKAFTLSTIRDYAHYRINASTDCSTFLLQTMPWQGSGRWAELNFGAGRGTGMANVLFRVNTEIKNIILDFKMATIATLNWLQFSCFKKN